MMGFKGAVRTRQLITLLVAALLWVSNLVRGRYVERTGTDSEPDRRPYTDPSIPWCIMGMHCLGNENLTVYKNKAHAFVLRSRERFIHYPFYTYQYGIAASTKETITGYFKYFGPTTTVTNTENRDAYTKRTLDSIANADNLDARVDPYRVRFGDYGDEFVHVIPSKWLSRGLSSCSKCLLYIMKAPTKIEYHVTFTGELRVILRNLIAGPTIRLAITTLDGEKMFRYAMATALSCGNDRMAVFDVEELYYEVQSSDDFVPILVYLLQYVEVGRPAKLGTVYLCKMYKIKDVSVSIRDGAIILKLAGLQGKQLKPRFALLSDTTVVGTPTLCGSSNAQWHALALDHKYDNGIEIKFPFYLLGQKGLLCATINGATNDILAYTTPLINVTLNAPVPPGVTNMIGVDATGRAEIVLKRNIHPLSEIRLVESGGDPLALGVASKQTLTKPETILKRDLKLDEEYVSSLGHVSLDTHAIFRRIDKNIPLPLRSTHQLTFPPAFSYLLGDRAYWSARVQFLPQMLLRTNTTYTIFVCDRWKRPHCLSEFDFNEPAGVVIPNRFIHSLFRASWESDSTVSLTIATATFQPRAPHVILVRMNMDTLVDYDKICNTESFISAKHVKTEGLKDPEVAKSRSNSVPSDYFSHTFKVSGIENYKYYICYTFEERQKSTLQVSTTSSNTFESTFPNNARWHFMTILNPQMIPGYQRVTFRPSSNATGGPVFTTSGVIKSLRLSGIYMTEDLEYDCTKLHDHINTIASSGSSGLQFDTNLKDSVFWLPLNDKPPQNSRQSALPKGFWLSLENSAWEHDSSYLVYKGPLNAEHSNYKVCVCYSNGCVNGGKMIRSNDQSIDVTRFVDTALLSRLVIGSNLLCVYGKGDLRCFKKAGSLTSMIMSPVDVKSGYSGIKCALLRASDESLLVVRERMLLIHKPALVSIAKIPPMVEQIYSFSNLAFVLLSDSSLYFIVGHDPLAPDQSGEVHPVSGEAGGSAIYRMVFSDPWFIALSEEMKSVSKDGNKFTMYESSSFLMPGASSMVPLHGVAGRLLKLEIVPGKDYGTYNLFYIDELFNLHHSTAYLSYKETTPIMETSHLSSVSLGWTMDKLHYHHVNLKAISRTASEYYRLFVFVHRYGSSKMTLFQVLDNEMLHYSSFEMNSKIVDFVLNDGYLIGLTRNISFRDEISQSLIEIDLGSIIRKPLNYPNIPTVLFVGEEYSFEPVLAGHDLVSFSTKHAAELEKNGLSLDAKTGRLYGRPTIVGKLTFDLEATSHFNSVSKQISFVVDCPLGHHIDKSIHRCIPCEKGTFWAPNQNGAACLSCNSMVKNSTTINEGSKSLYDCVCKPGSFFFNNECKACPEGTTSEAYGSTHCPVIKLEAQVIHNISVVRAFCKAGTYLKGDTCVPCPVGSYCFGGKLQPIRCSVGMTTKVEGAGKTGDCVCNAGYEWVKGECTPCSRTSYKETIGNTNCTPCPSGEGSGSALYTPTFGATSKRQCMHCKEGFYYDANKIACVACPVDSFCPGKGTIPLFCPINTVTVGEKATSINDCMCMKGFGYSFATRYAFGFDNICTQCPANTFQHMNGTNMECMPCPLNTFTLDFGASSLNECVPGPGYYRVGGEKSFDEVARLESLKPDALSDAAVDCVTDILVDDYVGIRVMVKSLTACVDLCKNNIYCRFAYYRGPSNSIVHTVPLLSGDSTSNSYHVCNLVMGYERIRLPNISWSSKKSLRSSMNHSNVLCMISRPRLSINFNNLTVLKCPMNHYCPGGDKVAKYPCPNNSVTTTGGASHLGHCMCLPGYEISKQTTISACIRCREGFYKDTISNARCSACPAYMTTFRKGSVSASQCACSGGYFAAPTKELVSYKPTLPDITHNIVSSPNASSVTRFMAENFNLNDVNSGSELLRNMECKPCPEGYVCPAKWLNNAVSSIHNPPISCPDGSTVPGLSQRADTVAKCMCKPGYGSGKSYGEGMFVSCEKCAPGTFSESYGASCSGRCNDYAITFPGASSFKDCFCLPGRFMTLQLIYNEYKFVCTKCSEGTVCPGGFRDMNSSVSKADDPHTAIFNHTPQYPRMGYMAIFKRKSVGKDDVLAWKPYDHTTYITHPPAPSQFRHYEHVSDIHPCIYPNRCKGYGTSICVEGSKGYLCGQCTSGYDTRYFQSICTKCASKRLEAARLIFPRLMLFAVVFITCYINHNSSSDGDFSVIVILKIWYMFVLSLVPLGMQQFTTSSSLRHFYNLHHHYFYKAITFFMHIERLGCWEPYIRKLVEYLNTWGLPKSIFDGSKELDYISLWYLQRIISLTKPFLDVLLLCIIYIPCHIMYRCLSSRASYSACKRKVELRIKSLCRLTTAEPSNPQYVPDDNEMTLQSLDTTMGDDSVVSRYLKERREGSIFLVQQILLLLTLHLPSVVISSLSMMWCTSVRYKKGPIINVLMHLPDQVCDAKNPLFMYGRLLGVANLALWFGMLMLLFYMLCSTDYSPRSWNTLFMSGCAVHRRWWDVVHLSRQCFLATLIVCQYSMDSKGDSEYMRTTCYLILHFVYMTLHLTFSPYDDRNGAHFYHLESKVLFSNIFLCIFIQGSYLYDFSDLDGLPILLSLFVHMKIIWAIMVEYGNINFARRKTIGKNDFICMVLDFLPSVWEHRYANVYYDYKNDNIVLESSAPHGTRQSFYNNLVIRPLSKIGRLLGLTSRASKNTSSCSYSLSNRDFLISCIHATIGKCNMFTEKVTLSNTWFYFIIRYVFWYCHCLHTDIKDRNTSSNALFHKVVFLHFFPQDSDFDSALANFLVNIPIRKLSSHESVHHNGQSCDGKCKVLTQKEKHRRVDEVAESLLIGCLFDTLYDLGPVSLTEFYFGLLSLNQLRNSTVLRLFEAFRIHSFFLKDEKEFHLLRESDDLNDQITTLKRNIEASGQAGAMVLQRHQLSSQIEEVESDITQINDNIKREHQIIMAGRAAAAAALNLHLGVDNFITEDLSHDDILAAISSLPNSDNRRRSDGRQRKKGSSVPIYKLAH
ncbi:GCC2 and GCC3 domain containing protein [Babesia divergens]|uniref:GCC2 and GCC3 domain containing protein n=1 Tax=Babesia divergens TaxID=32595 RepID=A0AAD9GAH1_BABDI|nr:GCC2 and GCC3 domain containing protein [Babesia divergens]